jgi:hypothetical protein
VGDSHLRDVYRRAGARFILARGVNLMTLKSNTLPRGRSLLWNRQKRGGHDGERPPLTTARHLAPEVLSPPPQQVVASEL